VTKCVGDKFETLMTDLTVLIINIPHRLTVTLQSGPTGPMTPKSPCLTYETTFHRENVLRGSTWSLTLHHSGIALSRVSFAKSNWFIISMVLQDQLELWGVNQGSWDRLGPPSSGLRLRPRTVSPSRDPWGELFLSVTVNINDGYQYTAPDSGFSLRSEF